MTVWTGPGTPSRNSSRNTACWATDFVEDYTGLMSWLEGGTRYTVVHSQIVAVLFVDTTPVDAITFHRDLLGSDNPRRSSASTNPSLD